MWTHCLLIFFCKAHDLLLIVYLKLGGGGNAAGNEPMTQPSPAKPTWAQILNSNPSTPSNASSTTTGNPNTNNSNNNNNNNANTNNNAGSHSSPASSTSSTSQHSAANKNVSPSASGTLNAAGSRPGFMPNFYDQAQSQMNWPLNFNQSSSWMINDDNAQRQPSKSLQSNDNTQGGGDGTVINNAY